MHWILRQPHHGWAYPGTQWHYLDGQVIFSHIHRSILNADSKFSYHIGKDIYGSTFGAANPNYNSDLRTYTEFLRTVYCKSSVFSYFCRC